MQIYDGRDSFYQWDSNQKIVGDFELGEKVEFGNGRVSPTYTLEAYEFNDEIVVDVPNILLQTALPIVVYRREIDGNSVATVLKQSFKVEQREKPSDYIYSETEVLTIQTVVEQALQEAKNSGEFDGEPGKDGRDGHGIPGVGENAEVFNGGVSEQAVGECDHAEGYKTKTTYARGHAEGDNTEAGWRSHAGGFYSQADDTSHASGRLTKATGVGSFAHGLELSEQPTINGTKLATTAQITMKSTYVPVNVSVIGTIEVGDFICLYKSGLVTTDCRKVTAISSNGKTLTLDSPFYEPLQPSYKNQGIDQESFVFPVGVAVRLADLCEATGNGAVAVGCATKATGTRAFAHGEKCVASGEYSEAGGKGCESSGKRARASGTNSKATGDNSVAEGDTATASGKCSNAKGAKTNASGNYSEAGGYKTTASGECSSARGNQCVATGQSADASGNRTVANGYCQSVRGRRNIPDPDSKYLDIVGNNKGDANSNAYTLDWDGNGWFAGDVYVGGEGQDDSEAEKLVKESDLRMKLVATGTQNASNPKRFDLSKSLQVNRFYLISMLSAGVACHATLCTYGSVNSCSNETPLYVKNGNNSIKYAGASFSCSSSGAYLTIGTSSPTYDTEIANNIANLKIYEFPY